MFCYRKILPLGLTTLRLSKTRTPAFSVLSDSERVGFGTWLCVHQLMNFIIEVNSKSKYNLGKKISQSVHFMSFMIFISHYCHSKMETLFKHYIVFAQARRQ